MTETLERVEQLLDEMEGAPQFERLVSLTRALIDHPLVHSPEATIARLPDFYTKIRYSENGCWNWMGSLKPYGYGHFSIRHRARKAHRFSWEVHRGLIPRGLHLDHLCMNKACVNPDHLEPVTPAENLRRSRVARGLTDDRKSCKYGHNWATNKVFQGGIWRCQVCRRAAVARYYRKWGQPRWPKKKS